MKRWLLLGLGLLVAVLLVRAFLLAAAPLPSAPWSPVAIDADAAAQRLAGAIRWPSVTHQDPAQLDAAAFGGLHEYLRASYAPLHAALERETVSGWSLLYTWRGRNPALRPVLLAAHLDVVPVAAESAWTHPPFGGVVADGQVWGRGAIDDKGNLIAQLEAVSALLAEGFVPERTVYLAYGHDEEGGGYRGALEIAALLEARGVALEWVLDEGSGVMEDYVPGSDAGFALVGIAEKGSVSIGLEIEAPGGHSSAPPHHTAIGELARALVALEEHPMPARLDGVAALTLDRLAPELSLPLRLVLANRWLFGPLLRAGFRAVAPLDAMQRTTTAVTIFEGGVKNNVLPRSARAVVNFRIHPNDHVETVVQHVRRVVNDERIRLEVGVASTPRESSPVSPVEGDAFRMLAGTIRSVFSDANAVPFLLLGGTDARHYAGLTPNIYRFTPLELDPDAIAMLHGTDERMPVAALALAARFYAELIRRGAGAPQASSGPSAGPGS